MALESIINVSSANIKYGPGATGEVGFDMKELGVTRVMLVTDRNLEDKAPVTTTLKALAEEGLEAVDQMTWANGRPAVATVPLLRDGCVDTEVDVETAQAVILSLNGQEDP